MKDVLFEIHYRLRCRKERLEVLRKIGIENMSDSERKNFLKLKGELTGMQFALNVINKYCKY